MSALRHLFSDDKIREIEQKFNISVDDITLLGRGEFGYAYAIDDYSVLKITISEHERITVRELVDSGLILEPGFATILLDDMLSISLVEFAYRTERLYTFDDAVNWAMKVGMFSDSDVRKLRDDIFDISNAVSTSRLGYWRFQGGIPEQADWFINELQYMLDNPIHAPLVLSLYQAATTGLFLLDVKADNLGFRYEEDRTIPAIDAGLVLFDPLS